MENEYIRKQDEISVILKYFRTLKLCVSVVNSKHSLVGKLENVDLADN